ncbi:MAG: purine-binding chemotaxis protein CheW [Planctomycetes bacterium]|nr:purine-binding chemotaxis protein CheW [Planctomycetota bacterium]
MNAEYAGQPLEILVFEVGGQRHGLLSLHVQELLPVVTLTPLPQAPAHIEGIMNLRGRVVPVLDIRAWLRLPPKPPAPSDHLIVARTGDRLVALRVDRATELVRLERDQVEHSRSLGVEGLNTGLIAKLPNDLVPIHDLEWFLSPAELAALVRAVPALPLAEEEG